MCRPPPPVGVNSEANFAQSIALGTDATVTDTNQLVIGSTTDSNSITSIVTPGFKGGDNQYASVDADGNWGTSAPAGANNPDTIIEANDYTTTPAYNTDGDLISQSYTGTDLDNYFKEYDIAPANDPSYEEGDLKSILMFSGTSNVLANLIYTVDFTYDTDGNIATIVRDYE